MSELPINSLKLMYPHIKEFEELDEIFRKISKLVERQIIIEKYLCLLKQNKSFSGINQRTEKLSHQIDLSFLKISNNISNDDILILEEIWKEFVQSKNFNLSSLKFIKTSDIYELFIKIIEYNVFDDSLKCKLVNDELNKIIFEQENLDLMIDMKIRVIKKLLEINNFIKCYDFNKLIELIPLFNFNYFNLEFTNLLQSLLHDIKKFHGGMDWLTNDGCINTEDPIGCLIIFYIRKTRKLSDNVLEDLLINLKYIHVNSWQKWTVYFCLKLGVGYSKTNFNMGLNYDNENVCLYNLNEYIGEWKSLVLICISKKWNKLLEIVYDKAYINLNFDEITNILELCKNDIVMTKILIGINEKYLK